MGKIDKENYEQQNFKKDQISKLLSDQKDINDHFYDQINESGFFIYNKQIMA